MQTMKSSASQRQRPGSRYSTQFHSCVRTACAVQTYPTAARCTTTMRTSPRLVPSVWAALLSEPVQPATCSHRSPVCGMHHPTDSTSSPHLHRMCWHWLDSPGAGVERPCSASTTACMSALDPALFTYDLGTTRLKAALFDRRSNLPGQCGAQHGIPRGRTRLAGRGCVVERSRTSQPRVVHRRIGNSTHANAICLG